MNQQFRAALIEMRQQRSAPYQIHAWRQLGVFKLDIGSEWSRAELRAAELHTGLVDIGHKNIRIRISRP
nr:hypothetical protein [Neorhizobium huautlense]